MTGSRTGKDTSLDESMPVVGVADASTNRVRFKFGDTMWNVRSIWRVDHNRLALVLPIFVLWTRNRCAVMTDHDSQNARSCLIACHRFAVPIDCHCGNPPTATGTPRIMLVQSTPITFCFSLIFYTDF